MESDSNPLSAFADILPGTSPKGQDINSLGLGLPFFQGAKEFGALNPTAERFTERPVRTALKGDILVSVRAPVGRINIADSDCAIGRGVMAVRPKEGDHADFLFYVLRGMEGKWGTHGTTGSVFESLSTAGLKELPVPVIKASKIVGAILASLDDKIRLNTELSQTLEAIAQSIFKSWFIDFDPVHAKSRGEKPEGMSDEAAALFPDSFEESELGMIPKGWQIKPLGGVITPKKGKSITKSICVEGDVPVVGGGLHPAYFHNQANELEPVVTVSASGANAGYVRLYQENIWASDCSVVSTEVSKYVYYWYLFLSTNQSRIYSMQQGAAQPHIYPSDLMRLKTCLPSTFSINDCFDETVKPLFELKKSLTIENSSLVRTRDLLLPRLISGKLEIPTEMLES